MRSRFNGAGDRLRKNVRFSYFEHCEHARYRNGLAHENAHIQLPLAHVGRLTFESFDEGMMFLERIGRTGRKLAVTSFTTGKEILVKIKTMDKEQRKWFFRHYAKHRFGTPWKAVKSVVLIVWIPGGQPILGGDLLRELHKFERFEK